MQGYAAQFRHRVFFRLCSFFLIFVFSFSLIFPPHIVQAQVLPTLSLPIPGTMVTQTPGYIPTLIKGIEIDLENPFQFNFIIDTGESNLKDQALEDESLRVIKYFLASLTVPEKEVWVNLSPYEKDRIIPESFGKTGMGKDLLAEDYLLKQLTASLMYPEKELGKKFWDRVYARAQKEYGAVDISLDMFHKVWIVPKDAEVVQIGNKAFVVKSSLEVLMEQDYLALKSAQEHMSTGAQEKALTGARGYGGTGELSQLQTEIMREVIIPEITKEVNEGKNFARLRQIYNATILAAWFKLTLKESILGKIYVDQNKVLGVDGEDSQTKEIIYNQYIEAFKKGVYDYIKEDEDASTGELIPRRYFSGGYSLKTSDGAMLSEEVKKHMTVIDADQALLSSNQKEKVFAAAKPNSEFSKIFNVRVDLNSSQAVEQFQGVIPTQQDIDGLDLGSVRTLVTFYVNLIKINVNKFQSEDVIDVLRTEILDQNREYSNVIKALKEQWRNINPDSVEEAFAQAGLLPGQFDLYDRIFKLNARNVVRKNTILNARKKEQTDQVKKFIVDEEAEIAREQKELNGLFQQISDGLGVGNDFTASVMEEHPERVLPAIRKKFSKFPELSSQILLNRLLSSMSSREFLVHDVTLEAILSELEGDAQIALGKGGLGFLAGETFGAYKNGIGVMPLYDHPMKKEGELTPEPIDWNDEKGINRVNVKGEGGVEVGLTLKVEMAGKIYETEVYWVNRKGTPVFLLRNEEIFDQLYPEPSGGSQRMRQYGFIGKAYVELMSRLGIAPDVLRLNEAQLVFVEKAAEIDVLVKGKDSVFSKRKIVMTNHTPERAALPVFGWKREELEGLLGGDLVDDDMYQDENGNVTEEGGRAVIRASEVLARKVDLITTVSEEHAEVTKRHVLPQFAWKTTYVQNGSDPEQWHSAVLAALIGGKGFDGINGKDLFETGQKQKVLLNDWLSKNGFNQFVDTGRPLFAAVRRFVEYKEQGIFIAMARWITGDADKEYETPWGKQSGLGANLLIGGPISDGVGERWANEFRKLQEDTLMKGKLIFIDKTGTDIMGLATSAADVWLESPRPTREASGTSHQRALLNGKLVIASATGGQLAVVDHGKNSWLVDVFQTGGFTAAFDELVDALNDSNHPRYKEFVERYRINAQRLFGKYMTEAVDMYNAYKNNGDEKILGMMKKAFIDAHEKIGIDRMMDSYQELFQHVLDGTGAAGYESRQIPAKKNYVDIENNGIYKHVNKQFKLDDGRQEMLAVFLLGRGPIVDVINAIQEKNSEVPFDVVQAVVVASWIAVAYDLSQDLFSTLLFVVAGEAQKVQSLKLSSEQQENLEKDIESLRDVIKYENELRGIDQQMRDGKAQDVPPEIQYLTRKKLAAAWQSIAGRRAALQQDVNYNFPVVDEAMLVIASEELNATFGPLLTGMTVDVLRAIQKGNDPRMSAVKELIRMKDAGEIPDGVYLLEENTRKLAKYLLVKPANGNGTFALKVQKNTMDVISELVLAQLLDPDIQILSSKAIREYGDRSHYEHEYVHEGGISRHDMRLEATNLLSLFTDEGKIKPEFVDQALLAKGNVGGIDLNSAFLNLKIRRDDKGMLLPVSQQPLQELMRIDGLIPVIINITPIQSLPMMLGLEEIEPVGQLSKVE